MSKSTPMQVKEISGEDHPCLEAAQLDAKPHIARALVTSMRGLLDAGLLIIRDGKIIPNDKN